MNVSTATVRPVAMTRISITFVILSASLLLGLATPDAARTEPVLRWEPAAPELAAGEQATLAVLLDDTLDVRTFEVYVTYDPDVIASVDGGPGALFDGYNLFPGFEPEAADQWHGYCVILGADAWATGPGELFTWTVEALVDGVSPVQTVEVTLLPPGGGDYPDATLPDTQITVLDPTGAPVPGPVQPALTLAPNPFNPRTRITLEVPGGGPARLQVLNLRGQVVAEPWSAVAPADGSVRVDWDGTDRRGRALPSGVYQFRLQGPRDDTAWQRGVLVR
jgi:hypothetical protein